MMLTLLKSKIHRAAVTECRLDYEGSLTIDADLMDQAGILPYEQIDVLNINNGSRFTTYAIEGARGSGIMAVNGAAARLAQRGDLIIVCCYARMDAAEAKGFKPAVVFMDGAAIKKAA